MKSPIFSRIAGCVCMFLAAALSGCREQEPLLIPVEEFEMRLDPLPIGWNDEKEVRDGVDNVAIEQLEQQWSSENAGAGRFHVVARRYLTLKQAMTGYKQSLRRLRETRYTIAPQPEWAYEGSHADQYEIVCSPPETMGEGCVAIGRYVNMVVLAGIEPGEELSLTSAPGLFEEIDRQVQRVIKANQDN